MGIYARSDMVKARLKGKVRFVAGTGDDTDPNGVTDELLDIWIAEAEAELEQDLSPRYLAPFQPKGGKGKFKDLPERPTRNLLQNLAEMLSVVYVLENDFGRGSSINGEEYAEKLRDRYTKTIDRLVGTRHEEAGNGWVEPPLPFLALAPWNSQADDGYVGGIWVSSSGLGEAPLSAINSPLESWWTGAGEWPMS